MMSVFELGQWVQFAAIVKKRHHQSNTPPFFKTCVWARIPTPALQRGVFIGWRTVREGQWHDIGSDEWSLFEMKKSLRVALVVTSVHKNPVHVLVEDVQVVETSDGLVNE